MIDVYSVPGWCPKHDCRVHEDALCGSCVVDSRIAEERDRKRRAAVVIGEWRAEAFTQVELPPPVGRHDAIARHLLQSGDYTSGNDANPKQRYGDLKVPLHLVPPALPPQPCRASRG